MQHACECSLKCLDSEMEFIYRITKDFCSRFYSVGTVVWLFNHFKKWQTAFAVAAVSIPFNEIN